MPIKTAELDFSEDGYPGFKAVARINAPLRAVIDLQSGELERMRPAILATYVSWDFVDEEGEAIPYGSETVEKLPVDLITAMVSRWSDALSGKIVIPKATGDSSSPTSPSEPEASEEAGSLSTTPD
jgi:hypothetical protein